jgi:integrase
MAKQKLLPFFYPDKKTGKSVRWEHFLIDSKTKIIYYLKSQAGKKVKFSTKCKYDPPKVDEAIKAKRAANAQFVKRTGKRSQYVRTLIKEELESWLLIKESQGNAEDTMNNVRRAKMQIEEFWGDKLPNEINRDSFAEWCAWWKRKHSDIQMENAIKYLNNFCTYLHEKIVNDRPLLPSKLTFQDPNRHQTNASRAIKKERVLTHDEFKTILATAENDVEALIPHLMYTMATRIDETLKLDFSGRILLDLEVPIYRWHAGNNKAKKIGEHALHPTLIEPLRALRDRRRSEGTTLLFPQKIDNQKAYREQMIDWDGWRKRANLGWHWTPHTFKHTCLTNLFNDPNNPQMIICKLYRTSYQVAMDTYVKVDRVSMLKMRDSIKVEL